MTDDRLRLRATFDAAAGIYQEARPEYPGRLFDALIALARITPGDLLLEIGCATGKATIPLALRGFRITGVEIGHDLAAAARRNVAAFPHVTIVRGDIETWEPPGGDRFDLVFAATAWHWIDPALRYRRAWQLLRPGGHLAFFSAAHVFPETGDPFFAEIQHVYDDIDGAKAEEAVRPRPGELPDQRDEIERSGFFEDVAVRQFDWEVRYSADGYLALLDTFSGHMAMKPTDRDRLYAEIRQRLGERPDGLLRRHWGAVLHVARRVAERL